MATLYGDVEVSLDGSIYVVRVGNLEFWALEKAFDVKGIGPCLQVAVQSQGNAITFYKTALSRKHPNLTDEQVANLMDFRPSGDGKTLAKAVEEAVRFSCPQLFPDDEKDEPEKKDKGRGPKGRAASQPG